MAIKLTMTGRMNYVLIQTLVMVIIVRSTYLWHCGPIALDVRLWLTTTHIFLNRVRGQGVFVQKKWGRSNVDDTHSDISLYS